MFLLVERKDIIVVKPEYFGYDLESVVKYLINEKYSNQILQDIGLVVSLNSIVDNNESQIYQGEGTAYTSVRFQLFVFGPFVGEVLQGTIYKQTEEGIVVTLNFLTTCTYKHRSYQRHVLSTGENGCGNMVGVNSFFLQTILSSLRFTRRNL